MYYSILFSIKFYQFHLVIYFFYVYDYFLQTISIKAFYDYSTDLSISISFVGKDGYIKATAAILDVASKIKQGVQGKKHVSKVENK